MYSELNTIVEPSAYHPLDAVESILDVNDWVFDRTDNQGISLNVCGNMCDYTVHFLWDENLQTIQLCVQYEMDAGITSDANDALTKLNRQLWMGHFDISPTQSQPCFRYATMLAGIPSENYTAHLEHILDTALSQCEQYYSALSMLMLDTANDNPQSFDLALMAVEGHA